MEKSHGKFKSTICYALSLYVLLILCDGLFTPAMGQQMDSIASILHPVEREFRMTENPWLALDNFAGWQHHFQSLGNELQINLSGSDGDFHQPQAAEKETTYGLSTSGYKTLNGNLLYGKFAYQKSDEKDVQWNLMDNPYNTNRMLIADSIGGNWKRAGYALSGGIATKPIFGRLTAGLKLDYTVSNSARDNDPRPKSVGRDIAATPGISFHINSNHSIGAHFAYRSGKEELNVNSMSGVGSNMIYSMIGLREWEQTRDRTSVSMLNRSDRYTTGLQYEMNRKDWIWLTGFEYSFRKDENEFDPYGSIEVDDQIQSKTRPMGEYVSDKYQVTSLGVKTTNSGLHHVRIHFNGLNGKIWDAIIEHVSFKEKQKHVCLNYQFFRQLKAQIPWKTALSAQYSSVRYNELYYSDEKIENLDLSFDGNKYFYLTQKNILEFGIHLQTRLNLKESLIIDPQSDFIMKETAVSENIIRPNHAFFSENHNELKLFSSWAFSLNKEVRGCVKGAYCFSRSRHMGNRQTGMITVVVLF